MERKGERVNDDEVGGRRWRERFECKPERDSVGIKIGHSRHSRLFVGCVRESGKAEAS